MNTDSFSQKVEKPDIPKSLTIESIDDLVITTQPSLSAKLKQETPQDMFKEFTDRDSIPKENQSPERDLVEFSEEESSKVIEAEDNDDSEKVDFFIREKSSSAELDDEMETSSSKIDPFGAKPNPWFNDILEKGSSMIEDQIFGAVRKYEQSEEKYSDEEKMLDTENSPEIEEKMSPKLLEEDEIPKKKNVVEKISSSLSQLLKGESKKELAIAQNTNNDDTSDDDFMFRPVPNKRNKKKQKNKQIESDEEFYGYGKH